MSTEAIAIESQNVLTANIDVISDDDILYLIFSKLPSKASLANASCVNRRWRSVASQDSLWKTLLEETSASLWPHILFSETELCAAIGSDGRTFWTSREAEEDCVHDAAVSASVRLLNHEDVASPETRAMPRGSYELSNNFPWRTISRLRAIAPRSIIIDAGSGYCKFGWSDGAGPSGRIATFLEFDNIQSPMISRLRTLYSAIFSCLDAQASDQPIILSQPLAFAAETKAAQMARMSWRRTVLETLFMKLRVPSVCCIDQSVLALYSVHRVSGIVVNIGFRSTTVVPVYEGRVMEEVGVEEVAVGAMRVTAHLGHEMQLSGMDCPSMFTIRSLKENLCYVAVDYEDELRKDPSNLEASFFDREEQASYTLASQRFQAPEILFKPHFAFLSCDGIHKAVVRCMERWWGMLEEEGGGEEEGEEELQGGGAGSERKAEGGEGGRQAELLNSGSVNKRIKMEEALAAIVLAGGTAALPGLPERMAKEISIRSPCMIKRRLKVERSPYGCDAAWMGASIVANASTFSSHWCLHREDYLKHGAHCTLDMRKRI